MIQFSLIQAWYDEGEQFSNEYVAFKVDDRHYSCEKRHFSNLTPLHLLEGRNVLFLKTHSVSEKEAIEFLDEVQERNDKEALKAKLTS